MLKLALMEEKDIAEAVKLWGAQFYNYCHCNEFPDFFSGGREIIEKYLLRQIEEGNAIAAKKDDSLVGYMAWMYFDFHKERTAFLPIVGNAANTDNENAIFHEMYLVASKKWIQDNRFNHLWMTFFDDVCLQERLYNLGFGSYVIDACKKTEPQTLASVSNYEITEATEDDVDEVLAMKNESEDNLLKPPVFLVRKHWKRDEIIKLINDDKIFIAWDKNRAIGMMSVNTHQKHHFEHLTITDSAGSLCAYIRPEYRRKGVGTQLLEKVSEYCHKNSKLFLHVSFESANPDAITFWPKHFKPAIRSVRRTVNKDANTTL